MNKMTNGSTVNGFRLCISASDWQKICYPKRSLICATITITELHWALLIMEEIFR